ncbi:ArsS family sensor histidine kinase [Sulfurovum sp.]|uniref:ArsS family sensor histidine kinase n=1 Tax=Sulfurovum sp. TaxID=1969726 RepID=UPI002867CD80|nr:ArsS family sensor histidine kinase [Sulfurovum sp.]
MNRHSILFKLNILFTIALLATIIAAFSMTMHMAKKDHNALLYKSRLLIKEMRTTREIPNALLEEFSLKIVENGKKREILQNAQKSKRRYDLGPKHLRKHRKLLIYKGQRYLQIKLRNVNLLLEDEQTFIGRFFTPLLVLVGILSLLIIMYILLRRSLVPLKKLERDIVSYGEGTIKDYTYLSKKDEVSLASNAFYHAVDKVEKLKKSRELFIRNLFHELNTPVTKGKILTEIVDDPRTKEMMDSIFSRLSSLLKELAQMEKLTSENYTFSKKPVRIRELIDEASDLLYLEEDVQTNISDELIEADFSLMSMVFKNLMDNAYKYGENLEIISDGQRICFISTGEALSKDLTYYTEAFSKGIETSAQKGFGLGLYIVSEILKKHDMNFSYEYELGKNIFIIRL